MSTARRDHLYHLLPAFYRQLDERHGQPLRALMAVLESQFRRLEVDVAAMYDDWFIETCSFWVVPYIADLLGIRDLKDQKHFVFTQRRRVANTIGYRRRKGTPAVLEHVVTDVTGWHARCVEFTRQVARTQHMAHQQPDTRRSADVRQHHSLTEANRSFDSLVYTARVDNSKQGRLGPDRIGLYFWRLRSYPIRRSFARPVEGHPGCFTFDPLGRDVPLFNQPQPVTAITQRVQDINLPLPLRRADLAADLQAYRAQNPPRIKGSDFMARLMRAGPTSNSEYYGPDQGLCVNNKEPLEIASADLSGWPDLANLPHGVEVAVDVELGRLAFVEKKVQFAEVNYNYGFSSEVGGGPYRRQLWLEEPAPETQHIYVAKGGNGNTIRAAFDRWDKYCQECESDKKQPIGRVTILDNGLYTESDLKIYLPRGAQLTIAAGDGVRPIMGPDTKLVLTTKPVKEKEPLLGAAPPKKELIEPVIDRLLHLNGLVIDGGMQLGTQGETFEGKLDVQIRHCTVMPDGLNVQVNAKDAAKLTVDIQHSIVGPLRMPAEVAGLGVFDSIVECSRGYAIAEPEATGKPDLPPEQVPGPPVTLKRTTVFGKVSVQKLPSASEVIFTAPVFVKECERGGVSFSYVPAGSRTPAREFCQPPDDASAGRVRPRFTSVRFGDPAYAQLGLDCPSELRRGGRDGAEMGVFCQLHQPQREINLENILDEYLPFGMRAAIFYET